MLIKQILFFSKFRNIIYIFKKRTIMSKKVEVAGIMGPIWFMGWLFTIGFLKVTFFKGLLALFIWPYYLGSYFSVL